MKTTTIADKKKISKATVDHETVDLSIDNSGLVHIMSLLTDLYSNPREAVLREYVSNAIDSHRRFGVTDKRIQVTVPYLEKPAYGWTNTPRGGDKLIVRDYGVGMSKTELVEIYSRYGSSTKRTNNTEIGGFGLGAKSALAIAHRFDIVSIKDGIRVECYIEKNDLGIGTLHFVSETPTTEHSGVTITIPYTAEKTESELFAFFVGQDHSLLTINDKKFVKTVTNEKYFEPVFGDDPDVPLGWVVKKVLDGVDFIQNSETYITIGGVIYGTDNPEFKKIKRNVENYARAVVVNVPIGSVDFTPSREDLIYRGRTIASLTQTFASFSDAFTQQMTDSLNFIEDRLDAYEFAYAASEDRFWNARNLTWRGEKVPLNYAFKGDNHADEVRIKTGTKTKIVSQRAINSELYSLVKKHGFILARYTAKSFEGQEAEREAFGKAIRTLDSVYGIKGAIVFSDAEDWNNPWVKALRDSRFDSLTIADITAAGKALAAEQRRKDRLANASTTPKPKVRKPVERIAVFKADEDEGVVYRIEQIYAGDERLDNPKVYFVSQRDHTRVHPGNIYFPEGQDIAAVKIDSNGFWKLARRVVKRDKATVFIISSLRNMDKFMEKYPNAEALMPKVKEYAREKFNPNTSITYSNAMAERSLKFESYKYQHLGAIYKNLKKNDLVEKVSNDFTDIASFLVDDKVRATYAEKDPEYLILKNWSGINPESEPAYVDRIQTLQRDIVALSEKYFLLSNSHAHLDQRWQLSQLVNYINMVSESENA